MKTSSPAAPARTLYEKIWQAHLVEDGGDSASLIYIDRHLVHEVTSAQAFEGLRAAGLKPWRADSVLATADHQVPTDKRELGFDGFSDKQALLQVVTLDNNCDEFGIQQYKLDDPRQGILHVVGPEQGATLPGTTVVCGDSHTSTHGAFAALAQGIGTSEVEHVLATQTLSQRKAKTMQVCIDGVRPAGVSAKDLILQVIGVIGLHGGTGYVIEYTGQAITALSMEERMTVCNMSIEAGARAGLIAFDGTTEAYLQGRPLAPKGALWDQALNHWRSLHSDVGAVFDCRHHFHCSQLIPQVTWGTKPEQVIAITDKTPDPAQQSDPLKRIEWQRALEYMGLEAGQAMASLKIDRVFIGSCTNGRIEDIRQVAQLVEGRKLASNIKEALVVPGSGLVKAQAEAEGLDKILQAAGFQWRDAGCSMCNAMNPDKLAAGERCASTSNRNFEGRQGAGGRSHLLSPQMAAAAAIHGQLVDVRDFYSADVSVPGLPVRGSSNPTLSHEQVL